MINLSNLKRRLLFAVPAIPVGWWGINSSFQLLPGTSFHIFPGQIITILLIIIGCFEYMKMLGAFFPKNAFWISILWLATEIVLELFDFSIPLRYSIFVLLMIVAFEAIVWGEKNSGRWKRASLSFSATVWLYIAGVSILYLFNPDFNSFFRSYKHEMFSRIGFGIVIGSILLCDTMAYFVGSQWGKHHFSNISPNKTIEGSAAGFATAFIVCLVCWIIFRNPAYPWYLGIFMGLILGVFAQVGDLLVSLMKRYFKTKNASEILPGHGGILDRFGSIYVAVPTLGLFLLAFASDDYVKTIDEYFRFLQNGQYAQAYEMISPVAITCNGKGGEALFGPPASYDEWVKQNDRFSSVRIGKIEEVRYWKNDSMGIHECQLNLGLRCFQVKMLYKLKNDASGKTSSLQERQTKAAWVSKGVDGKIRIMGGMGTLP
jgi:phosphatidate cytidylyltransferase